MLHQLHQPHGIVILEVVGLFSMTQYDSVQTYRHAQDAENTFLACLQSAVAIDIRVSIFFHQLLDQ